MSTINQEANIVVMDLKTYYFLYNDQFNKLFDLYLQMMISTSSRLISVSRNLTRQFHLSVMAPISVGDKVPNVTLFEDSPGNLICLFFIFIIK